MYIRVLAVSVLHSPPFRLLTCTGAVVHADNGRAGILEGGGGGAHELCANLLHHVRRRHRLAARYFERAVSVFMNII
jgi:hypothetical protein